MPLGAEVLAVGRYAVGGGGAGARDLLTGLLLAFSARAAALLDRAASFFDSASAFFFAFSG